LVSGSHEDKAERPGIPWKPPDEERNPRIRRGSTLGKRKKKCRLVRDKPGITEGGSLGGGQQIGNL